MVDICCNDPDNGLFAGRAVQIQCGVDFIELEALRYPEPKLVETETAIRLAGKTWPILGSKYGIGNWCWNGYWFRTDVAVDFFVWLHSRKLYDLTCGEERLFNLWRLQKPLDRKFLSRVMGKPSFHRYGSAA